MQALAIWLLFFGLLPLLYLLFRILFDWIAYLLLPKKTIIVEFEGSNGTTDRAILTGKTQKELYKKAIEALRSRDDSRKQ
ncbi:TPA: hypothetical protein ACHP08_003157 [Providencia stuartii]